jgi:uncharacterized protein YbgA (DUF1722 family)/uncharacterized protein YbbK (DUF523 family)
MPIVVGGLCREERAMDDKLKLGVSTCLLGEPVRYDGGHKRDPFIVDVLGRFVQLVPVCPEFECGLGVPRESMHLEGDPAAPRLITTRTRRDLTERMLTWCRHKVRALEAEDLCGFVFKSKSPSSGMERVQVFSAQGMPRKVGVGLFARAFMDHFPLIPVEEEGRLHDPVLRENFIEAIFALKRLRDLRAQGLTRGRLVEFHARHKLLLMSHSPTHDRELGRLVAEAKAHAPAELGRRYGELFVQTLRVRTTVRKHANVLQHMMGYFKRQLTADQKQELLEVIAAYQRQQVPLVVPLTLLRHYVRTYQEPYLGQQHYLDPHPAELMLRNHV